VSSALCDGSVKCAQCGCTVWNLIDGGTVLLAMVVAARCVADCSRDAWQTADRSEEGC